MKKFLSLALVFVLVLVTLTSCDFLNKLLNKGEETTTTPEETTPPAPTYDIDAAADFFDNLYKDEYSPKKDEETGELVYPVVQADLTVVAQIVIDELTYTVEWAVDSDKVTVSEAKDGFITIDVDEESKEEVKFTLSATIKDGNGKTATRSYQLIVPIYTLWSHEEYMNAKEGDSVVVKGVVVAMNSTSAGNKRNHLFLADLKTDGGYYSYDMGTTQDPVELGIEVGMIVEVSGPATPYTKDGVTMAEIKGGSARIVDTNKQNVAPIDVTAKFAAGESLVQYVGRTVTIKGVEIGTQEIGGSSDYLWFKLGDKSAYLRTYLTDMPHNLLSKDEKGTPISAAKTTIEAEHLAHFGYSADVTGVVIYYGAQVYLMPLDTNCFVYGQKVEKTPEQKIADVLGALTLGASFGSDTVIDLPTSPDADVTLSWATNNATAAAIADGKLTIKVPNETTTVEITVTVSCGTAEAKTKIFSIKLSKEITPITEIIEIGSKKEHNTFTEEKYIVAGIITEVYQTTYGNMKIKDELGNIIVIYGTYIDGKKYGEFEGDKPVAGDYVVLTGIVGKYNSDIQVKNADLVSFTKPTSVKDAATLGAAKEQDKFTSEKYVVTGEITEIKHTTYGNMYIKDAEGNTIYLYGLYSSNGKVRFDAMKTKPAVGDTITVYGILGNYNGAQMKNGWLVAHTPATPDQGGNEEGGNGDENKPENQDPAADSTLSIKDAAALGVSKGQDVFTTNKYYVTGEITEIKHTTYGNMYIKDAEGNTFYLYGLYSADGKVRFDAMETKPAVGDTITVYGIIGNYNGAQMKNGWMTAHTPATPDEGGNTPADNKVTYTFSAYTAGTQYAMDEVHTLDDKLTVTISDGHFNTQLRLYDSSAHDGIAILKTATAIKSLALNAGNKAANLEVYGSTNGTDWVLIDTIETKSSYADYTVNIPADTAYTYIKLDAVGDQIRVASVTFGF